MRGAGFNTLLVGDHVWLTGAQRDLWLHRRRAAVTREAKPLVTHVDTYWKRPTQHNEGGTQRCRGP